MDREKVIARRYLEDKEWSDRGASPHIDAINDALALLKEQDTANLYKCPNCGTWVSAENVVRCKDCDNKECWGRAGDVVCGIDGIPHRPDWFCAYGVKRDD